MNSSHQWAAGGGHFKKSCILYRWYTFQKHAKNASPIDYYRNDTKHASKMYHGAFSVRFWVTCPSFTGAWLESGVWKTHKNLLKKSSFYHIFWMGQCESTLTYTNWNMSIFDCILIPLHILYYTNPQPVIFITRILRKPLFF